LKPSIVGLYIKVTWTGAKRVFRARITIALIALIGLGATPNVNDYLPMALNQKSIIAEEEVPEGR